ILNIYTNENATVTIMNSLGSVVNQFSSFSNQQTVLDLNNQANGVYFVKITDPNGSTVSKIHLVK
ncbi:MAG TPA: T9SS type A sorting domain-containing protein, partial [Flavisolibacter sp.]|nr:T9SS type A sorting domain-containing protein [Flavisolibacter sp.]